MQRRPAISKAFINLNKAVMANEGKVTSALKKNDSLGFLVTQLVVDIVKHMLFRAAERLWS